LNSRRFREITPSYRKITATLLIISRS